MNVLSNTYADNSGEKTHFILMQKGGNSMKKFAAVGAVLDTAREDKHTDGRIQVFDFSVTTVVADGKIITVSFPDEGKPLDS